MENDYLEVFFLVRTPENGWSEVYSVFRCTGGAVDRGGDTWQLFIGRRTRRGPRGRCGQVGKVRVAGWQAGVSGAQPRGGAWLASANDPRSLCGPRGVVRMAGPPLRRVLGHVVRPD